MNPALLQSTIGLRDISATPWFKSKHFDASSHTHWQSSAFLSFLYRHGFSFPDHQTPLHPLHRNMFIDICRNCLCVKTFRSDFILQITFDLVQSHLRLLRRFTPQRSARLDWCPAQTVTTTWAACIHPFLCSPPTADAAGKVVQKVNSS